MIWCCMMLRLLIKTVIRLENCIPKACINVRASGVIYGRLAGWDAALKLARKADRLVWVGDGSAISNGKVRRAYEALSILEQNSEHPLTEQIRIAYNKFSNKTGKVLEELAECNIGGAPRYEHATAAQILGQLAPMGMFDKLL